MRGDTTSSRLKKEHKELGQTIHTIVAQMRKENECAHSNCYQNSENENDRKEIKT